MAQFEPGQSGNPSGRPSGSKNRSTKLLESIEQDLPALLAVTKEKALQGDMTAMRLLFDRGLPVRKPLSPVFDIPELAMASTLTEQAQAVLSGVCRGFIPPDVGSQLIMAIGATAKVLETDELVRRIIHLEQATLPSGERRQEVLY